MLPVVIAVVFAVAITAVVAYYYLSNNADRNRRDYEDRVQQVIDLLRRKLDILKAKLEASEHRRKELEEELKKTKEELEAMQREWDLWHNANTPATLALALPRSHLFYEARFIPQRVDERLALRATELRNDLRELL